MRTHAVAILIMALTIGCMPASTQKKTKGKAKAVAVKAQEEEEPEIDPKVAAMLGATERVMVVDSVVVRKDDVLRQIHTNPEEGRCVTTATLFPGRATIGDYAYINQLGNRCIYALTDSKGKRRLFYSDLLGTSWSQAEPLPGISSDSRFEDVNHPFLMADGVTLYFSAKATDGLGGYDIYRTRLDPESGRFLRAENIGMPFNSDDDDFLYVINETDTLGFFATTRRQKAGYACVYTFLPTDVRQTYNADDMPQEELLSLARLDRIADTWSNRKARQSALKRIEQAAYYSKGTAGDETTGRPLVINDQRVCYKEADFKYPNSKTLYQKWVGYSDELDGILRQTARLRQQYSATIESDRSTLSRQIRANEREELELRAKISSLEKQIRNNENN